MKNGKKKPLEELNPIVEDIKGIEGVLHIGFGKVKNVQDSNGQDLTLRHVKSGSWLERQKVMTFVANVKGREQIIYVHYKSGYPRLIRNYVEDIYGENASAAVTNY